MAKIVLFEAGKKEKKKEITQQHLQTNLQKIQSELLDINKLLNQHFKQEPWQQKSSS
ncbi:MAG: hypothetical protein RIR11_2997 [Bacteroidota bacterium]|jgi:hypothetical protein